MQFYNGVGDDYLSKKIIISDLDGTLTMSKMRVNKSMSAAIHNILRFYNLAIVTGGEFSQLKMQLDKAISEKEINISKLFLFPTNGTKLYRFTTDKWVKIYSIDLSLDEKKTILEGFELVTREFDFARPERFFGRQTEDRGSQVTYSALGQNAPISLKILWDPDAIKRNIMKQRLEQLLPEFEVKIGGKTSIDVTKRGFNKSYTVKKLMELTGYSVDDMLFVGDSLFEGGNDYSVRSTKIECVQVENVEETLSLFNKLLSEKSEKYHL